MVLKLFSLYPPRPDAEMAATSYMEELRDIPSLVLSHGLKRLVQRPGAFVPPVADIRRECARIVRSRYREARGADPSEYNPHGDSEEINVDHWLAQAHVEVKALPAGRTLELPAADSDRKQASAVLQAEIERLERRMGARR